MGGGEVEAQCLIKIGKNKRKYVGLKIKLSERRAHYVYFYLYKSKYSAINIQFSFLNFKKIHPRVQNNVRNCAQHKQKNKTKKQKQANKKGGNITVFLLTFLYRVVQ